MDLTKDADKAICVIYKEFLNRRDNNMSKFNSANFTFEEFKALLPNEIDDDLFSYLAELSKASFIKNYDLSGGFELSDKGIIYMEQRFGKKLDKVLDYLSKLIP